MKQKISNLFSAFFKTKRKIKLLLFIYLACSSIAVVLLYLFGIWTIGRTIKSFYTEEGEQTFVSNYNVVKSDDFEYETDRLSFNLLEPKIATYYRGSNYKGYEQVVIADFFYLKHKGLFSYEIARYESSFVPYYAQDGYSLDQAYDDMKNSVKSKKVTQGLTPDEERKILESSFETEKVTPNTLIDYIQSLDGDTTIEIRSGEKFGTNYLVDGRSNQKLEIENVINGVFSTDSRYLIYTTGSHIEPLGILSPNADIWIYDFATKPTKIIELEDKSSEISIFSDGKVVLFGTKESVEMVAIDGSGHKVLLNFEPVNVASQYSVLPKFEFDNSGSIDILIPSSTFEADGKLVSYSFNFSTHELKKD